MAVPIDVTIFNDPGCPWAYSAIPALRVLDWRYAQQLRWRLVLIGLTEDAQQYADRGYDPLKSAQSQLMFRRWGMPFSPQVKPSLSATSPACRVVVAARLDAPGSEWAVHRELQFAQFTTDLVFDDQDALRAALSSPGLVDRIDDEDVRAAYKADRSETRSAAGGPGALQGKTANTDGAERYTAPSLILERDGRSLEAAGFQPIEALDVLVANLDPSLERRAPAQHAREVLERFPDGVTTAEVAAIMASGSQPADRDRAEVELLELVADQTARRTPIGDGALWYPAT